VKIILDTNVIIAAFAARGLCNAVFELCLDRFCVVLSESILQETRDHLNDKIKLPVAQCEAIISYLSANCSVLKVNDVEASACRDKDDLHVLGLAQCASADYIITGDKDLLDLVKYGSTNIVTPREFWKVARGINN
jgi:putative PIN family toxin of toxin-antitoxin system